jgi:hypothetical protein
VSGSPPYPLGTPQAIGVSDMPQGRHSFSIEMTSKSHMDMISVSNEPKAEVMFEGELGGLVQIEFIEGIILQITGENGVLRIDLTEKELFHGLVKRSL